MAEKGDILVEPKIVTAGGLGRRFSDNYTSAYPSSPIHSGDMTDEAVRQAWADGVQTADSTDGFNAYGSAVASGDGNRFDSFNVDFTGTTEDPVPDVGGNAETFDGKAFGEGQGAPDDTLHSAFDISRSWVTVCNRPTCFYRNNT